MRRAGHDDRRAACVSARRCWAALVLALGLFIAVETPLLEVPPSYAAVGPRLFPYLVAGGLARDRRSLLLREAVFGHIAHEPAASSSTGWPWRSSRPA